MVSSKTVIIFKRLLFGGAYYIITVFEPLRTNDSAGLNNDKMTQTGVPQNLLFEYNRTKVTIFKRLLFGGAYFIITVFELLRMSVHSKTKRKALNNG